MKQQEFIRAFFQADCLEMLKGVPDAVVNLVYLDPPFNKNKNFQGLDGGSLASEGRFGDMWGSKEISDESYSHIASFPQGEAVMAVVQAAEVASGVDMRNYLVYMAERTLEMHRVLNETGILAYQCDDKASHYIKAMLDAIFGEVNFLNEVIIKTRGSARNRRKFGRNHQTILLYGASGEARLSPHRDPVKEDLKAFKRDETGRLYKSDTTLMSIEQHGFNPNQVYEFKGVGLREGLQWRFTKPRMQQEFDSGNVVVGGMDGLEYRRYIDNGSYRGPLLGDLWGGLLEKRGVPNPGTLTKPERMFGYPTQKPLALLSRIIQAATQPGDLVMDPFAGGGTTLVAAETEGRQWVGCDVAEDIPTATLRRRLARVPGFTVDKLNSIVLWNESPFDKREMPAPANFITAEQRIKQSAIDAIKEALGTTDDKIALAALALKEPHAVHKCCGCLRSLPLNMLEKDHIRPRSEGGPDDEWNLQLLCGPCNKTKRTKSDSQFKADAPSMDHYAGH